MTPKLAPTVSLLRQPPSANKKIYNRKSSLLNGIFMKYIIGIMSLIGMFSISHLVYADDLFKPGEVITADKLNKIVQRIEIQENWKSPDMQNGWTPFDDTLFNPPGFFKDSMGIVHLRGAVKGGVIGGAIRKPIFTLPDGYRPEFREVRSVITHPDAIGRFDVHQDGEIIPVSGNNLFFILDGVTFRAK